MKTAAQVALWLPRWHLDRSRITPFAEAEEGRRAFFLGRIESVGMFTRGRLKILKLMLADGTGRAWLYWFNRPYLAKDYRRGRAVVIRDLPERTRAGLRFSGKAGTCESLSDEDARRLESGEIVTFYRSTTVISQARAREIAAGGIESGLARLADPLPEEVRRRLGHVGLHEAIRQAHRPDDWEGWERARRRLVFDQLFLLQVALARGRRRHEGIRKERTYRRDGRKLAAVTEALPFTLTGAQRRAIDEVAADLCAPHPMNRLLQGDVGSGKTAVAAAAVTMAADSGHQAAVMAPTEILAEQHLRTFRRLLEPGGVRVALLVSGQGKAERRQIQAGLEQGYFDLVVGTHALLEPGVEIPRLGLAVIDERHKFGVRQRARLESKGRRADLLMMTATPLPRALILTQYGDTTLTVLDEMPPGRGGVTTAWLNGAAGRAEAYRRVAEGLARGERAFVVLPLVEESEHLELRDATREFERLKRAFPDASPGLIHGRMAPAAKEKVMDEFASGSVNLLVSTTVVEVGIDVPQATMMVVEHADRYGLAQLHQLRGRIGRSAAPSRCWLLSTGTVTGEARQRLEALTRTTSGFALAEQDLKLRGPGELFGTRQHGALDGEYLDRMLDVGELETARREAEAMLGEDPELSSAAGRRVREALETRLSASWGLARAS